jgi:hypothetical protein
MKTWKLIRIYKTEAMSKTEAYRIFGKAEEYEQLEKIMTDEFVVEDKPKGLLGAVKKQLFG